MPLLEVENLTIDYHGRAGTVTAVEDVSFSLEKGRSLGIVGESGCGKTTLGMALLRLLPENGVLRKGTIRLGGDDVLSLSDKDLRAFRWKKISMIFQAAMNALNPVHRVGDQVAEAIRIHHPAFSAEKIRSEVAALFELVDIPAERMGDYPHQYSGGMKQRAVIAMALSCRPELVVADEPTTALDVIVQDQILRKIREIQEKLGIAGIFISHDIGVVAGTCHDIMVMYNGRIIETGRRDEVFVSPGHPYTIALLSSYLTIDGVFDLHAEAAEPVCAFAGESRPGACGYAHHCPRAEADCFVHPPDWREKSSTHRVLCSRTC